MQGGAIYLNAGYPSSILDVTNTVFVSDVVPAGAVRHRLLDVHFDLLTCMRTTLCLSLFLPGARRRRVQRRTLLRVLRLPCEQLTK